MGLVLILDFNEDRWLKMPEEDKYFNISTEKDFINRTFEENHATISFDTISIKNFCLKI